MNILNNRILIIIFVLVFLPTMFFFFPAHLLLSRINLPANVQVLPLEGSLFKGQARLFVKSATTAQTISFNLHWRACASLQIPFYAVCLRAHNAANDISAKIVGFPKEQLKLQALQGKADIDVIGKLLIPQSLFRFSSPSGSVSFNINNLALNIEDKQPLSWDGTIDLINFKSFNIDFPDSQVVLTNEPFISQAQTREGSALTNINLPTFRFSGKDTSLAVASVGQVLEDSQVKARAEVTVLNSGLRALLLALNAKLQDDIFIWEYNGPWPFKAKQPEQGEQI